MAGTSGTSGGRRTSGGNTDIYRVRLSDHHIQRLTHDNVGDFGPVYSPDGRFIAYEASAAGGLDIFTMRADGSRQRDVSGRATDDEFPRWIP